MDAREIDAYLRRIGAERPARPDVDALRELHLRHLLAVPFENLSIHLGEPLGLDEDAVVEKVAGRRRGGMCYELNGAFGALLRGLGYGVELLAGRVYQSRGERAGELGPPYDHLALRVEVPGRGGTWLADVGFGRHTAYPLRYTTGEAQHDPGGVFGLAEAPGGDLDVLHDGSPVYRFEQRPRALADFGATFWYHRTSPESHFRTSVLCSILTADGRATLTGRRLVLTGAGDAREERELAPAEVLPAYREHFGVTLDREPAVAPLP
jgi:N-hydroxyarylamine O-acetyltransferase